MELKNYLKIIKKDYKLIIVISIIVAISAFVFSILQPIKYETSLSLFIVKDKTQETKDFKYDGYYALQTGEIIANLVEQWMKSPEVVSMIYQEAGVAHNFKSIKSYTKKFTTHKMSAQYVEVKFKSNTKEEAEKISAAVVKIINTKTEKLKEVSEQEISFFIENRKPIIVENRINIFLNLIIGFVSGIFFGILFVFSRRYFSLS